DILSIDQRDAWGERIDRHLVVTVVCQSGNALTSIELNEEARLLPRCLTGGDEDNLAMGGHLDDVRVLIVQSLVTLLLSCSERPHGCFLTTQAGLLVTRGPEDLVGVCQRVEDEFLATSYVGAGASVGFANANPFGRN